MRNLRRVGHIVLGVVTVLLGLAAVAGIVVVIASGTPWGHERVRRVAVSQVDRLVHGRVLVGHVSGNLLAGMTVDNFAITDSTGAPFLAAQQLSVSYDVWALLHKHIWLDRVSAVRPVVVLDKRPGTGRDTLWNFQRIFPANPNPSAPHGPGWGSWIRLTNASVGGGLLVVRSPWTPGPGLNAAQNDSAIRDALGGRSRLAVVAVPHGFQKIVELRDVHAEFPLLRIADPAYVSRLAQVATLQMEALPFRPPAAIVRDVRGTVQFTNDSVWWQGATAVLPASRISGDGSYGLGDGSMRLHLHGEPASLADLRWLYPRLPSQGSGRLDFDLVWRGATQDYLARNANVRSGHTRITGSFGLTLADTFTLHDTNLRFAAVDTRLLEELIPNFHAPLRGSVDGRARANGGRTAMEVDANVAFAEAGGGTSRLGAVGEIGFGVATPAPRQTARRHASASGFSPLRARDLHLVFQPVQVDLLKVPLPTLPIGGIVTGSALVNGSTGGTLTVVADVDHDDQGNHSSIVGHGAIRLGAAPWFNIDATARPISLAEVGRFAPSVGLKGWATGPLRVTGPLRDLSIDSDLRLPESGEVIAKGHLDLAAAAKGYDVALGLHLFDAQAVLATGPRSSVTAQVAARGRGTDPATLQATLTATVMTSSWDSLTIDSGSVRASAADGMAQVAKVTVAGAHTHIDASGSLGLAPGRSGTLTYHASMDSLSGLQRFLPGGLATTDTGLVAPRSGRVLSALRRASRDSARVASATEVERAATGKALPRIQAQLPTSVPRLVSGSLYTAGTVSGTLQDLDVRGRLSGQRLNVRGSTAYQVQSEYALSHLRTPAAAYAVGLHVDSLTTGGFAFDTVDARLSYHDGAGAVQVLVRQDSLREYTLRGDYLMASDNRELHLANLRLRFDTTVWDAPHAATLSWRGNGLQVVNFELRSGANGRVYANGLLPTAGVADFTTAIDNFDVGNIADLLQTATEVHGLLSLRATVHGTLAAPAFQGSAGFVQGTYNGAVVPVLRTTFGYANQLFAGHMDLLRSAAMANPAAVGVSMATVDARLPINLAMQNASGPRLLDAPATADLVADSLPLDLLPQFTSMVSQVRGVAAGRVALRGTTSHPVLTGGLTMSHGIATIAWPNVTLSNIAAAIRMANDTVFIDSLSGTSRGPVRATGTIAFGGATVPQFAVKLTARNALVLNNMYGRIDADGALTANGSFERLAVGGTVNVTGGVAYAPEPLGRHVISAGDPGLFMVVDTTVTQNRLLFPAPSPLEQNLHMDVSVTVQRNTWVRNNEANVEIFTDYPVSVHYDAGRLGLTGAVSTDRGDYTFMSKRFEITRGSATFTSGFEVDPLLQITGDYKVEVPNAPAMDIKVLVGGSLRRPSLTLASDVQPPKTQSELLSLLAFGTSQSQLPGQISGSGIATVGAPGDLVGAGAAIAMQRLTGVALGVAVEQAQESAGRALGTDFFDITPGATPDITQLGSNWNFNSFLANTELEAGKYLNQRTFLGFEEVTRQPGVRLEYRPGNGWRYTLMAEPRVILQQPTLLSQPYTVYPQIGAFIIREWKF